MEKKFDFSGWATKANLKCSDGRIITEAAFKHCDGIKVPLVWGHKHDDPNAVLGHALLEYRKGQGIYAYGKFNETEQGMNAKILVEHGDVKALSIYANQLRQDGPSVLHGEIRELSLVLAGANPGAFIENVMMHSEEGLDPIADPSKAYIRFVLDEEEISLYHEDADDDNTKENENVTDEKKTSGEKTVAEVWDGITKKLDETEMNVVHAIIGLAAEGKIDDDDDGDENKNIKHEDSEGGNESMKSNVFDNAEKNTSVALTHEDQTAIIALARQSSVGSLQQAINIYMEDKGMTLAHGIDELETLFPEFKNIDPGAPEMLTRDQGWITKVINGVHKSPFSRVRTRKADARIAELKAKGYKKGEQKTVMANIKLLGRQFEPQTIYIKDEMHRDDILDITDFSVVDYEKKIMKMIMNETVAMAIMVGDQRDDTDPDKIREDRICPIWTDNEFYTIHYNVDIEAARAELQGTNTSANFSENYIYAAAIIKAALYSREQYKGAGTPDFYCAPHLVNVMLLARDLNGRRIYNDIGDLARALNVGAIHTAEQFEGLTRTDAEGNTKKLLGLFVNLSNYQVGSTKGGELTTFDQFDIDFNKQKFLMECRLSGGLVDPYSAIALEELVEAGA